MKIVNVLFLGGAKRVSLAEHLIKAGLPLGLDVRIFSYELDDKVPLASVGQIIIGKRWKDDSLAEDLIDVINDNKINIILPFVDPAVEIAAMESSLLPNVFIPVSSEEICSIMFDKKLSERWFMDNGIPIPQSYKPVDDIIFPVIIKPRRGSASKGIEVIYSKEDWKKVGNSNDYVIQEYISDKTEYTVDCYVAQNGEIISVVPRERLAVAGGEVLNSQTVIDNEIDQISRRILTSGDFKGPVTIQFIRNNENGKTYVMEINPRLGGGVITSIEAGADIPTYILKEYLAEQITPCEDWKPGTLMTRYFKEVIFYADNN